MSEPNPIMQPDQHNTPLRTRPHEMMLKLE